VGSRGDLLREKNIGERERDRCRAEEVEGARSLPSPVSLLREDTEGWRLMDELECVRDREGEDIWSGVAIVVSGAAAFLLGMAGDWWWLLLLLTLPLLDPSSMLEREEMLEMLGVLRWPTGRT